MANILVVDDDTMLTEMLASYLERAGHRTTSASTLASGLELARIGWFDVVFLDVQMPDGNGLQALPHFAGTPSRPEIIIMTGSGDPFGAKKAIQSGAWSYLEKPHVLRDLLLPLTRALQYREEKTKIDVVPIALKRDAIIGKSTSLMQCLDQLAKAATSEASVLITGETGTGKELFARAVHDNSSRSGQPFVVVDCASLPDNLIESTLFGHVKGSFTGADRTTTGLIKLANGGTLFLDEVGEMPERIQKIFLRVLQERYFRPIGATQEEYSDFRIVAATNRDLERSVEQGRFRSDLLYRLRSLTLHLPPLRERKDDIRDLARYFLARLTDRTKTVSKGIADELFEYLLAYDWPGNVRELQQTMEQVFANGAQYSTLFSLHLPEHIRVCKSLEKIRAKPNPPQGQGAETANAPLPSWKRFKGWQEAEYLRQLFAVTHGSMGDMTRISGLSRARLYQLINQHGVNGSLRSSD